jgi:rhamnogalacturonyl hydrolase YesR
MLAMVGRWPSRENDNLLIKLLPALDGLSTWSPSPSRKELASRAARKPADVARQLLVYYGRALPSVQYIPATALIARVRYGELTKDATHRAAVSEIVAQAFAQPPKIAAGGDLAGHLLLAELARDPAAAEREQLIANLRRAADLAFDPAGKALPAMTFHNEMSDAVFMSAPLLAAAGRLTGEPKYHEACVRNIEFLHKLVLRPDGIYRHSPLDDAAWGRGNGFGALGLALVLADLPENHPARPALLEKFRVLAARPKEFQDTSGMWRQVIDQPGSYRELTATCMIAYAFSRGVRAGWLDREEYQLCVTRAWEATLLRIPENGRLVDVCTGTGKQRTLKDYLNRPALLQRDDRGGAMALLLAVELAP